MGPDDLHNEGMIANWATPSNLRVKYNDDRCGVRLYSPQHDVIYSVISGHLTVAGAKAIERGCMKMVGNTAPFSIVADWYDVTNYDKECRVLLTEWAASVLPSLTHFGMLTSSRFVAMGISVANLMLSSKIHVFTDPALFETDMKRMVMKVWDQPSAR